MIHWNRMGELRSEIGEDDFDEVVEIFLEEVEEIIDRLRFECRETLEQDLHFLRGCAMNLGFEQFSTLCEASERLPAANVDLPKIVASYESSKAEFLSGLRQNKS
ncbi:MAG: Hpt domain-containing protein [Paracoccaceae bacterium]